MNTEKAIDKIKKLLALATSNNPNEAENALLMARKLMAEYKLTERDVTDAKKPGTLQHRTYEAETFSSVKNGWLPDLARVIAENHCCGIAREKNGSSSVYHVHITGLGDDPDMVLTLLDYAVQHILFVSNDYRKLLKDFGVSMDQRGRNEEVRAYTMSYAKGFTSGLAAKYREQFKEDGENGEQMALALVQPVEVKRWRAGLKPARMSFRAERQHEQAQADGYKAGYRFNPTQQIKG